MTQFTFTGDYDAYGQPAAEPRPDRLPARLARTGRHARAAYLATRANRLCRKPTTAASTSMDRVAKRTTYEIQNDGSHASTVENIARDNSGD